MADGWPYWRSGVIYQLLVPSFYDTNGDGLGDLPGVTRKLDYLEWLGVDAIWLSPIYSTPFLELGYDVIDYLEVYDAFGTLEDFDSMVSEAHRRGIRILLDWVPNHTSAEHPWFKESRASRDSDRRNWYVWHDPKPDGSPPNNWLGIFGGSVWAFDEATEQYYLHTFLEEQPDLNWRHGDVRHAMYDAMRFWLDRGVDGFRIDALDLLVEDEQFRDNPPNPNFDPAHDGPDMAVLPDRTRNQPVVHDILAEMRRVVDDYDDRVLLGELYLSPDQLANYYGRDAPELHLPLNPIFAGVSWSIDALPGSIDTYLGAIPDDGWPSWMLSTHDGRRVASRAGSEQARTAAMLLLTLRGTPIIYYGDEIGMHDVAIPEDREQDPQGKLIGRKRDPVRTPMQWDVGTNAGFSSAQPWLPVADDFEAINVNVETGEPSLLELYRSLLSIRRREPALVSGSQPPCTVTASVLSYRRELDGRRIQVLLNLGPEPQELELDTSGRILLSTYLDREEDCNGAVRLRANEGVMLQETDLS